MGVIGISSLIGLMFVHLIADFFLQSHWMSSNKSKHFGALLAHITVYSLSYLIVGLALVFNPWRSPQASEVMAVFYFTTITFITHFLTDMVTSRMTSRLWSQYESIGNTSYIHWFFVVIGIDQFIHFVTLVVTYTYLMELIG